MPESKNDKFFYGRGRIQTINYSGPKGTTPYTFGLSGYMRQAYPSKKWPWNLGEELLPSEIRVGEKLKFPWEYIYPCSFLLGPHAVKIFNFTSTCADKCSRVIPYSPARRDWGNNELLSQIWSLRWSMIWRNHQCAPVGSPMQRLLSLHASI